MAETKVVLLTLLPTEPREPEKFHDDIAQLKIEAYDLTVKNSKNGVLIGSAEGATSDPYYLPIDVIPRQNNPPQPPRLGTAIFQHFSLEPKFPEPPPPIPAFTAHPKSVATAAILVNLPDTHSEFDSLDLRFVLTRGGQRVGKTPALEFNVPVRSISEPLPEDPVSWIQFNYDAVLDPLNPASRDHYPIYRAGYVFIPPVPKVTLSRPGFTISNDGVTPVFDDLIIAVNKVLADDHSSTDPGTRTSLQERPTPLDPIQSLQIARELVFDRTTFPLPAPKKKVLEDMYGNPNVESKDDQDRKEFEANLTAYHAQHDAEALQLANFIYAISAAIECEKMSLLATSAGLSFHVIADPSQPKLPFPTKSVLFQGVGDPPAPLVPTFGVPAAFYYALGCNLPTDVNSDDRQNAASITSESAIFKTLQAAQDNGILKEKESALTNTTNPLVKDVVIAQAARRLSALGSTRGNQIIVTLSTNLAPLVENWLKFTGDSATVSAFWIAEGIVHPREYFDLLLDVIVEEKDSLKDEIIAALNVHSSQAIASVTDQRWRDFWLPIRRDESDDTPERRISLLPNYTSNGSPKQRVEAFIKYITTLFSVAVEAVLRDDQPGNEVKILTRSDEDVLQMFLEASPGFSFAVALDDNAIQGTLDNLSASESIKEWVKKALHCIAFLFKVTTFEGSDKQIYTAQFSLMESLYVRGFITPDRVAALSKTQFRAALSGTVAYRNAPSGVAISDLVHDIVGTMPTNIPNIGREPGYAFSPVNPGQLVDCIPPEHLSPYGPNAYLRLLLSTLVRLRDSEVSLLDALDTRRGPFRNLEASPANLEFNLPLIDLANESLEALVELVFTGQDLHGAVHNTQKDMVGSFKLGSENDELDYTQALVAIPQHSTPQLSSPPAKAYDVLRMDPSSPNLPYDQELDINRSYLSALGSSRLEFMRTFRKAISEFALDNTKEPKEFRQHLRRYPIRFDISIEYLNISQYELDLFFTAPRTDSGSSVSVLYGFPSSFEGWESALSSLPVFLERTGLSYCEFYELWDTQLFNIRKHSKTEVFENTSGFPECEPCCLASLEVRFGDDNGRVSELYKIAVFIRLWRKVESRYGRDNVSLTVLADICRVLVLFNENVVNPDFICQLVSLFMLCNEFGLPLCEEAVFLPPDSDHAVRPENRVPILALWTNRGLESKASRRAIKMLLEGTQSYALKKFRCKVRPPQFVKILEKNLHALSMLSGFTIDVTWYSKPTCTIRFAEVLAKIYASPFTVGEILFLFTNQHHLVGDDPFPYTEKDESKDDPLNVPEDDDEYGLWKLRCKILEVSVNEDEVTCWSWHKIEHSLRKEFGFISPSNHKDVDPLTSFAEHFFPSVLHSDTCPCPGSSLSRQFRTPLHLEDTTPEMWKAAPCEPFHYDSSTSELWIQLPLRDEDVVKKLSNIRQLTSSRDKSGQSEIEAVTQLYFAPRLMLTPFTSIFGNLAEAVDAMVQETCEKKRFIYFQKCFALFHKRCHTIAEHLASHVHHITDSCDPCLEPRENHHLAWKILRNLIADENRPKNEPWEQDSGATPDRNAFLWDPAFTGGAFSALLGICGTGIVGTFTTQGANTVWKEVRGPLTAFGGILNEKNVPVPMVIPALDLVPTAEQRLNVFFRNGLALDGITAEQLGGAQPFRVEWEGVLLIDRSGHYRFSVHRPCVTHGFECKHESECCDEARWSLRIRRGQRRWTLINHNMASEDNAPQRHSDSLCLTHGAYDIEVCLEQPEPDFEADEPTDRPYTGFAVRYCGPDTEDESRDIPFDKLYLKSKDGPLRLDNDAASARDIDITQKPSMLAYLDNQFVSSLRDIRRTYQRAFKALLFAKRFCLSANDVDCCHGQSELGFLLSHSTNFSGVSYYPAPSEHSAQENSEGPNARAIVYKTHYADFDFNLLPVKDAYRSPTGEQDKRTEPSPQRSSALFDWWERIFDYRHLALDVEEHGHCHGGIWHLFYEAATQQPRSVESLTRLIGIENKIAPLVLSFFESYRVTVSDLQDEEWTVRVWHAWQAIQRIQHSLFSKSIPQARPDLWAATSPSLTVDSISASPQQTGNQNLIDFITKSLLIDHDEPQFCTIKELNDGPRVRANKALVSYLTVLDRVPLNFQQPPDGEETTPKAKSAADLSALLLQDVSPSLCQLTTRTSDAISSVQTLIQRIRLGLEPALGLPTLLNETWDRTLGSFDAFQAYARRHYYSENWIQWEELRIARDSEAFQFFEENLGTRALTVPKASPPFPIAGNDMLLPGHGLLALQSRDMAVLTGAKNTLDQGIDLLGIPTRSAQPSWLSSRAVDAPTLPPVEGPLEDPGNGDPDIPPRRLALPTSDDQIKIPMWFRAAVRLGTTFIRVAAASVPPAIQHRWDEDDSLARFSCACGKIHAPVMDEYYFWVERGEYFKDDNAIQNAEIGVVPPDPTSDWERDASLPKMLHWPKQALVYLHWTRVHCGEFSPPRRSAEGAAHDPGSEKAQLTFNGRNQDSLLFGLFGSATRGFRYDIAPDAAIAIPQVTADVFPADPVPAPLSAYPYFIYFEPGAPIFPVSTFGSTLAIAGSLRTQCKFEEALKWCKVAFDPLQRENTWAQCNRNDTLLQKQTASSQSGALFPAFAEVPTRGQPSDGPCCPTSPVQVGIGRARAVLIEYVTILLQWGDSLLCHNSYEARKQASVLFDEAIRLLGPKPSVIKSWSNSEKFQTMENFRPAAAPLNPKLMELYERTYDKKELLTRCSNGQRLQIRPAHRVTYSNPRGSPVGGQEICCGCGSGGGQCCLPYKFSYLLPKAQELVSVVKSLGGALLGAIEKGDSEYLASIRQAQDRQMNELVLSNRQNSYRESDWQVQGLEQQLQGALTRLRYYQQLIKNDLNRNEHTFLLGTQTAMQLRVASNVSESIGQGMNFIPDFTIGGAGIAASPVAVTEIPIGTKLAQVFQAISRILNTVADVHSTTATVGSTKGGWDRRLEEWQHQINVITIEIAQIKRQQLGALRRRDVSLKELNNHKVQIENSAEVDAFLRDKMSKQDLYLFMQQETAQLHRRTFNLAWETVKEAEAALKYERPDLSERITTALPASLGPAGWDSLHSGLMAGERLEFALHSLDRMYMREAGCREYELSKHISLRLHLPLAFLQLKTLGWCEFELPEWMFDVDYPGHYLRRIKNVSVTIPCLVGPYVGVHCRLQLLSNGIRLTPTLPAAAKCCCKSGPSCIGQNLSIGCEKQGISPQWAPSSTQSPPMCTSAYTDPTTLSRDFLSSEAIATSSGQNDSGLFELSFRDEKLRAPFEFAGAVASRWRVELPPRNNAFDLESLTDFVLHINYTAKEGGVALRDVADRATLKRLPGDGVRFFDVRSEFPTAWSGAFGKAERGKGRDRGKHGAKSQHDTYHRNLTRVFPLHFSRRAFPFLTGHRNVIITSIDIFIEIEKSPPCAPSVSHSSTHFPITFKPNGGCRDDWKTFECTASCQTPGFFHGVLGGVYLQPSSGAEVEGRSVGDLDVPGWLAESGVGAVYFLCRWEILKG